MEIISKSLDTEQKGEIKGDKSLVDLKALARQLYAIDLLEKVVASDEVDEEARITARTLIRVAQPSYPVT